MAVGDDIAAALKAATKDLHAEKKRRDRDARRAARYVPAPADRVTLRDAVFEVIPAAVAATSGNGAYQFPCRNLFYAVRPRIQAYTDAELKYNYFSQDLVVEYEQAHGPIDGMYREPRGTLHAPPTGYPSTCSTRSSTSRRKASARSSPRPGSRNGSTWRSPPARANQSRRSAPCSSGPRRATTACSSSTTPTRPATRSRGRSPRRPTG